MNRVSISHATRHLPSSPGTGLSNVWMLSQKQGAARSKHDSEEFKARPRAKCDNLLVARQFVRRLGALRPGGPRPVDTNNNGALICCRLLSKSFVVAVLVGDWCLSPRQQANRASGSGACRLVFRSSLGSSCQQRAVTFRELHFHLLLPLARYQTLLLPAAARTSNTARRRETLDPMGNGHRELQVAESGGGGGESGKARRRAAHPAPDASFVCLLLPLQRTALIPN